MKDLEEEHLCTNCERYKREQYEQQFKHIESWRTAVTLLKELKAQDWWGDENISASDIVDLSVYLERED